MVILCLVVWSRKPDSKLLFAPKCKEPKDHTFFSERISFELLFSIMNPPSLCQNINNTESRPALKTTTMFAIEGFFQFAQLLRVSAQDYKDAGEQVFSTLQHTAAHCNTLQHTATHYNTLLHTATHCNTLQHTATHCTGLDRCRRVGVAL